MGKTVTVYVERSLKSMRAIEVPASSYKEGKEIVERLINTSKFTNMDGWDIIGEEFVYSDTVPHFNWGDIVRVGGH